MDIQFVSHFYIGLYFVLKPVLQEATSYKYLDVLVLDYCQINFQNSHTWVKSSVFTLRKSDQKKK